MQIIPADQRHFQDFGWLKAHWLFSFDTYRDPKNMHWGRLRVFNDDLIAPGQGFDTHAHSEMEIISIILKGEITHKDSMGNEMIVKAGEVQRMSAGTGITHSEYNRGSEELSIFQIWLFPHTKGLTPEYEQAAFVDHVVEDKMVPLVSGTDGKALLSMHAEASIEMAKMSSGAIITQKASPDRFQFLYLIEGAVRINEELLGPRDQARISKTDQIKIEAVENSNLVYIETT